MVFNEYLPKSFSTILKKKAFNPNSYDESNKIINDTQVFTMICYEAFYSYFVSKKIKNANIMYLISSEKFFNESYFGKKQYNNILKLRCIENGLPLIKCSSNGKSLVINSKGKILFSSRNELNIFNNLSKYYE